MASRWADRIGRLENGVSSCEIFLVGIGSSRLSGDLQEHSGFDWSNPNGWPNVYNSGFLVATNDVMSPVLRASLPKRVVLAHADANAGEG